MVVLRCTQKLLVRLKQASDLPTVESTTRLGDWYGNILWIGRRQHLLFISERSRLPVVIPIREGKRLGTVFPDAVCEVLANVGVTAADIAEERSRMSELTFGRTRNRSLLGTLNDFAFMAQIGGCAADRTRVARGADAVPLADTDSSSGRRQPNRVDPPCFRHGIITTTPRRIRSLRHLIVREQLGASRLPSATLRRFAVLTRPTRSLSPSNYRSDTESCDVATS